jgi:hypothetical protein
MGNGQWAAGSGQWERYLWHGGTAAWRDGCDCRSGAGPGLVGVAGVTAMVSLQMVHEVGRLHMGVDVDVDGDGVVGGWRGL